MTEPPRKYPLSGPSRVMNAPREYYPVGYDKNFDDNFVSRVELPDTAFYCGEQKHFPGLYADEDLGCMVRHNFSLLLTSQPCGLFALTARITSHILLVGVTQ